MGKKKTKSKAAISRNTGVRNTSPYLYVAIIVVVLAAVAVAFILQNKSSSVKTNTAYSDESNLDFIKEGTLRFLSPAGKIITQIDIEMALNETEWMMGLMFREELGANQGMLFIYPYEGNHGFWMKNTIIPLDMIFVNSDYEIVTIHKNTEPLSEKTYPPTEPIQYAVEVNAGFADKYDIKLGDKASFEAE